MSIIHTAVPSISDTAVEYVQRDYRTYVSERQELLHSSEFDLCQLDLDHV